MTAEAMLAKAAAATAIKPKGVAAHLLVLQREIAFDDGRVPSHPRLVFARRFFDGQSTEHLCDALWS